MFAASLERAARWAGDREAFLSGGERISWGELADRGKRLAAGYRALGLQPGDRVATLLLNGLTAIELFAATAYSGIVIVPLNYRWSDAEIAYALADCAPRLLVFDDDFRDLAIAAADGLPLRLVDAGAAPAAGAIAYPEIRAADPGAVLPIDADALLGIFYTGGTTGRSKGVMLSHANIFSNAMASTAEGLFGENSVFMHSTPMFHIAGALCLHGALLSAARNVVLEKFDPGVALALIQQEKVSQTLWVPTMIGAVIDHPAAAATDVSSMQNIAYGAAPITQTVLERAMKMFDRAQFTQLYGMTETSPNAAVLHSRAFAGPDGVAARSRAAGRPILGTEIRIVGTDGREVPRGDVGEIAIRGPGVMKGYWNLPDATQQAVKGGWMHTGDGGRMDADGFVYLADRMKDMIITGGENVFSVEVENVIAAHPSVQQCAVVGIPHPRWGEAVHAIIVPHDAASVSFDEIRTFCRASLSGFKVPQSIEIRDEPLPLSATGKILKRELRAPYWS